MGSIRARTTAGASAIIFSNGAHPVIISHAAAPAPPASTCWTINIVHHVGSNKPTPDLSSPRSMDGDDQHPIHLRPRRHRRTHLLCLAVDATLLQSHSPFPWQA
ncbi:hypothetical protein ACLOJK_018739 [Asimina triloba]